jgi:hypothetical protein
MDVKSFITLAPGFDGILINLTIYSFSDEEDEESLENETTNEREEGKIEIKKKNSFHCIQSTTLDNNIENNDNQHNGMSQCNA